ncbi:hypothetical protein PV10_03131 [Exophiala mesophila]|uniref:NAD-dependent epimerase/dehydratase domain-containing protein n=1 Tax=Exophiala mesophila TaxID=212818 RepID=A0A0D2A934_EXOME|nr:uncharacterized protein PV10_03131 [Exophiala mesophila]KIV95478.1 hypothetical protein PV10_03131 [Exophiala mesophila]
MGALPPNEQTILITGISGYVAAWIAHSFLEAGYNVRGTVRSEKRIDGIKKVHEKYADKLSFAIVPDSVTPGAFNEAAKGVIGIIHTANPFVLNPKDNEEELLTPSINGVINALEAAHTQGSNVSRFVLTGSFANILDLSKGYRPGYVYSEADWNPATYEEAKNSDSGAFSYCAAKGLAERAGWDWMEKNTPAFDFVSIDPPWIFGPTLGGIKSLEHLNESTEAIWKLLDAKEVPPVDFGGFADVRLIGEAHLKAYEVKEAGNQRFLVGSHFDYQTAVDHLRKDLPELRDRLPEGVPGAGLTQPLYQLDGSKAQRVLGIEYIPLDVSMKDTMTGLLEAAKQLKG